MTVGIDCADCGEEVVFWLDDGPQVRPTAECSCGAEYQLRITKLSSGTQANGGEN